MTVVPVGSVLLNQSLSMSEPNVIIPRTEYQCARYEGHQGHVFKDGSLPRKKRWCNIGIAQHFVVQTDPLPSTRG